jgi:hypothetical protein
MSFGDTVHGAGCEEAKDTCPLQWRSGVDGSREFEVWERKRRSDLVDTLM